MDTAMKWGVAFVPTVSVSSVMSFLVQLSRYTRGPTLNRHGIWS